MRKRKIFPGGAATVASPSKFTSRVQIPWYDSVPAGATLAFQPAAKSRRLAPLSTRPHYVQMPEPLPQPDHRYRVPLAAGRAGDLTPVQFRGRRSRRQSGQLLHDRPHALGQRGRFLLAALAARRPAAEFLAARLGRGEALLVRCEIRARSFCASAANRCSTNGSTSRPSSVTMNGTRCAIRPEMKCTSRDSRSSLETDHRAPSLRAALMAAASCGRRSSASAPLPVSLSSNVAAILKPSAAAKALMASRWAARPWPVLA